MRELKNETPYSSGEQTLYEALVAEGSQDQADLLPEEVKEWTKADFINFLNGEHRFRNRSTEIPEEYERISLQIFEMRRHKEPPHENFFIWPNDEIEPHIKNGSDALTGGGAW